MRRVFGESSFDEEKIIKWTMYVFCAAYLLRCIVDTVIFAYQEVLESIFIDRHTLYTGAQLILWLCWDFFPLGSMLVIHYRNFKSFSEETLEILYTEYTIDDARGSNPTNMEFRSTN